MPAAPRMAIGRGSRKARLAAGGVLAIAEMTKRGGKAEAPGERGWVVEGGRADSNKTPWLLCGRGGLCGEPSRRIRDGEVETFDRQANRSGLGRWPAVRGR